MSKSFLFLFFSILVAVMTRSLKWRAVLVWQGAVVEAGVGKQSTVSIFHFYTRQLRKLRAFPFLTHVIILVAETCLGAW